MAVGDKLVTLDGLKAVYQDVNGNIVDLKSLLYIKKADTSLWTVGSIGTDTGSNAAQSKRLRMKTYVPDNVKGISFDNEYSGVVYAYDPEDNDSYVGAWTGSGFSSSAAASWLSGEVVFATLSPNNYKYRVVIKNSGGTAMSASEAVNAPFIYVADDTLTSTGVPADAKKVGDELSTLNTKIDSAIDDAFQANMKKVDASAYPGNLENIEFPSVISSVDDLLRIEKTYCVLHDNFSRADNASEIGYNGSGNFKMMYTAMGSNSLSVGISNKTAVSSGGSSGDVAFRVKTLDGLPYKACMSFSGQGALVISPADASNYIKLSATPNAVSIAGVGNAVCTAASVEHNGNCSDVTAYVYHDKIRVYVADEFVLETAATVANSVCGLFFAYGESNVYTSFELFLPTNHIPVGIDNAIEKCATPSATFLGFMAQADPSYGITFDSENTNHSLKSIRFEQKKADSMGGTYRSEITPPYMRPRNYPLQSKVFSFDVYFPDDYDYDSRAEILWQMHHTPDNVNPDAMYPNISFGTYQGHMQLSILTYPDKASNASDAIEDTDSPFDLGEVVKEKWRHFDVYLREGYLASHNPVTAVYLDGECKYLSRRPNGYNTTQGSYLKMGMYKSAWTSETTETSERVVYFDNIKIWQ